MTEEDRQRVVGLSWDDFWEWFLETDLLPAELWELIVERHYREKVDDFINDQKWKWNGWFFEQFGTVPFKGKESGNV